MHSWLENYEYHITINIWMFVAAGAFILLAMLIVGLNTIKAAIANPVKSLRSE